MTATHFVTAALLAAATTSAAAAQTTAHRHHLPATPSTVAWGYYSADAKPVLRVASGDTVDVETLLTNSPRGLERAGLDRKSVV